MTAYTDIDRRTVIRGLGGLAIAGSLAGCSTDGGDGGDGGDGSDGTDGSDGGDGGDGGGGGTSEIDEYLSNTDNYDSVEDMTGQDSVTVMCGTEANGGYYGFGPAAITVSAGTTVVWEWTGEGGSHNIVDEDGDFESELTAEEGFTFEHTFEETGTNLYYCSPHETLGMKGAVVVE